MTVVQTFANILLAEQHFTLNTVQVMNIKDKLFVSRLVL
jgi:hypothetical protein